MQNVFTTAHKVARVTVKFNGNYKSSFKFGLKVARKAERLNTLQCKAVRFVTAHKENFVMGLVLALSAVLGAAYGFAGMAAPVMAALTAGLGYAITLQVKEAGISPKKILLGCAAVLALGLTSCGQSNTTKEREMHEQYSRMDKETFEEYKAIVKAEVESEFGGDLEVKSVVYIKTRPQFTYNAKGNPEGIIDVTRYKVVAKSKQFKHNFEMCGTVGKGLNDRLNTRYTLYLKGVAKK